MDATKLAAGFSLMLALTAHSGCASLASMKQENVAFRSNPPDAQVIVRNEAGDRVATATTPAVVAIPRGRGFLKGGPKYTATIEKPGYQTAQVEIKPKVNPWIAGNILLGGFVGLAIDSANGAMWRLSPKEIKQDLVPYQGPMYGAADKQPAEVATASYDLASKSRPRAGSAITSTVTNPPTTTPAAPSPSVATVSDEDDSLPAE